VIAKQLYKFTKSGGWNLCSCPLNTFACGIQELK
jgi:hypothetical protein